ncbi:MAG: hypothetical protein U0930_18235 [Pirellulales bacterium]
MNQLLHKKPIRTVWLMLFFVMFCCCSGSLTTWFVAKKSAQAALAQKLADLKSRGVPIDDSLMAEYHAENSSDEISVELASIIDYISSPGFTADCAGLPIVSAQNPPIPPVGKTWLEQPNVEQILNKHSVKIARLIELTQNNGPVRLPIKFKSINTLLPYTQNIRQAVRILALQAQVAAHKGDAEGEFRAINSMLGCSIALQGEPTIISQLVSLACCGIARSHLKNAVQANRLLPNHYEKLSERLTKLSDIGHFYRVGLIGELGMMTRAITDPNALREQLGGLAGFAAQSGLAERAAIRHAEYIELLMDANTDDLAEFRGSVEAIEASSAGKASMFNIEERIIQGFSPAVSQFADTLVRHRMGNDLAILSMAIRRYEHLHGELPKSLDNLSEFGIEPGKHKALDGNEPLYQVVSAGPANKSIIRCVLWSFDNRQFKQTSPTMPELQDIDQADDDGIYWWAWFLN